MIEIAIAHDLSAVDLRLPAATDSLPVARHAVRALGEALDADAHALGDAESAVCEACAGAIVRARPPDADEVELRLRPHGRWLRAAVCPGAAPAMLLGLRARGARGSARGNQPGGAVARLVRRVTAMFAARVDPPSDRLVEALFLSELVARLAPRRLAGGRLVLGLDARGKSLLLRVGPLVHGGALAMVADAEVPAVGSVIDRLADAVTVEPTDASSAGAERLVVAVGAPAGA